MSPPSMKSAIIPRAPLSHCAEGKCTGAGEESGPRLAGPSSRPLRHHYTLHRIQQHVSDGGQPRLPIRV